jgi:hypothetical protein
VRKRGNDRLIATRRQPASKHRSDGATAPRAQGVRASVRAIAAKVKRHLSSGVGTMLASQTNPWIQTIRLLSRGSQLPNICNKTSFRARRCASFGHDGGLSTGPSVHRVVSFIEQTSSSTVTIAWRDSTSCSYGAQIWMGANAKVSGVCAMSGAQIKRGDRIFHPRHSKPAPVNAGAMILASAIDAAKPV